jgi:hypothetical protein
MPEPINSLRGVGEPLGLRAGFWVPPSFQKVDPLLFPFVGGIDKHRVLPSGVEAVARTVFATSAEIPTLDAGFADPDFNVIMAPQLDRLLGGQGLGPVTLRVIWRVWAKNREVVWLDTITTTCDPESPTGNARMTAFNRCVREHFQKVADGMRAGMAAVPRNMVAP